jgi:hypothetical protein
MKRARVGIIAIAALAVATVAFAQKPDFSGTWTADPPAAGGGGGGGGRGGGGPMTVKQTATELTIEQTRGENKIVSTYKLDGSPSKNTAMGRGGTPTESVSTVKWDGSKLVISTKAGENESTQTWSLAGGVLTIDRTGGRGPSSTTYKKST